MKTTPFFFGVPPKIESLSSQTVENLLNISGLNTGNFLFTDALRRVVFHTHYVRGHRFVPAELQEQHDCIVIPAANWLGPHTDYGWLAALIEQTTLPCVLVGIGAQSLNDSSFPRINPGTLRLLSVISERSRWISVRGHYTAGFLETLGIKNVLVTGCPSLLWHVTKPVQITKPTKDIDFAGTVLQSTRHGFDKGIFGDRPDVVLNRELFQTAFREQATYIVQSELAEMYFALGRLHVQAKVAECLDYLSKLYQADKDALYQYLRTRMKVFFDVAEWTDFLQSFNFVLGTRIHGVIAGLLAGTPALLIAHDTRTTELAAALNIPVIHFSRVGTLDQERLQALYSELDFSLFNSRYFAYYKRFVRFFEDNGLAHNLKPALRPDAQLQAAGMALSREPQLTA